MKIDEINMKLAKSYVGSEENFWFQGRFETIPHDEERERRIAWFREARLGLFPHWSPMAIVGRGGAAVLLEHMTSEENHAICENWHVKPGFAEEWCELARAAGAKYIVFTSNHCDGLKMWDSQVSDFTSVKLGPGRDLIAESVAAARTAGLRVGLYYSPSEPFAHLDQRYIGDDEPLADRHAFRRALVERPDYAERYRERIYSEMKELLTQYGTIDLWWHDGPLPPEVLPPEETFEYMRSFQPELLINDRVTAHPADFATQDYNESPHHGLKIGQPGRDWETGMPINMSWSYVPEARLDTMDVRRILHVLQLNVSEQGNLLLSIAPKPDGSVDDAAELSLRRFGNWVQRHAEAVYGRFQRPIRLNENGNVRTYLSPGCSKCGKWALRDEHTAYLWVRWWPGSEWPIGSFHHTLKRVTLLATEEEVAFEQDGLKVLFKGLPKESPDAIAHYNILKLEFEAGDLA